MCLKLIVIVLCVGVLLVVFFFVLVKELKVIGVMVGDFVNLFFVQIIKGVELEVCKLVGDNVKVMLVFSGYDLGQQVVQIDNFIVVKVDMIIFNVVDLKGIGLVVKWVKEVGIVVVVVDVVVEGVDVIIIFDNIQVGELVCKYISDCLNNKGNVVIINGLLVFVV